MDRQVLIHLREENLYGELVELGAHFSTVKYTLEGNDYEVLMENEDFVLLDDLVDEYWGGTE